MLSLDLVGVSDGAELRLDRLEVGQHGARLAYTLRPPWAPEGVLRGDAALPRPTGRAADPAGTAYRLEPGPSDGDADRLEGVLLIQPAPGPQAEWLDLELALVAGGSRGPRWRFRLPLPDL